VRVRPGLTGPRLGWAGQGEGGLAFKVGRGWRPWPLGVKQAAREVKTSEG
jgi:hypothetical protein